MLSKVNDFIVKFNSKVEMEKHYCFRLALMRFWDEGVPLHNIIPISLRPLSVIKLYLNLKTLNRLPTETSIKSKQIRNFTMRAYFHTAQFSGLKNKTEMSIGKNWPKDTCHRHHWERWYYQWHHQLCPVIKSST